MEASFEGLPLAPDGLASSWSTSSGGCLEFGFDVGARFADGEPVRPADLVDAWRERLDELDRARWLLAPVAGGVTALDDERLELCSGAPDVLARLAHPALWLRRDGQGPGFFRRAGGKFERNPHAPGMAPALEAIEVLDPRDGSAAERLAAGELDLAVVYGGDAARLLVDSEPTLRLARLESWDLTYGLWVDTRSRWVNDPRFRRWLAGTLDRRAMLDLLFAGQGEVVNGLVIAESAGLDVVSARPLAASSRPRLALVYDDEDRHAARIAARIRAELLEQDVEAELTARSGAEYEAALRSGEFSLAVLVHRPYVRDPVLGLLDVLWPLGERVPAEVRDQLEKASVLPESAYREATARMVEDGLLVETRVVPLVRLHAWLAAAEELKRARAGGWGVLHLERAEWRR